MKISEALNNYVFKTKIELDDDGNFIELKEPTMAQVQHLSNKDDDKVFAEIEKIFPSCIVSSSFTDDNGNPATADEVAKMLEATGTLKAEVLQTWIESLPFKSRLQKKEK